MQYYTPTPDYYNDYLMHYGVKGMKWRNHIKKAVLKGKNLYQRGKRKIGLMTGKYTEDKKEWGELADTDSRYKTPYSRHGSLKNRGYSRSRTSGSDGQRGVAGITKTGQPDRARDYSEYRKNPQRYVMKERIKYQMPMGSSNRVDPYEKKKEYRNKKAAESARKNRKAK